MFASFFWRLANGVFAAGGAAVAAQGPAFYRQYLQRLGGRLDQSESIVERLAEDAARYGESLAAYIANSLSDASPRAKDAGQRALTEVEENASLAEAYAALNEASPLERPLVFAQHFDPELAKATLRDYVPALDFSAEGLVYAAAGLLAGLLLFAGGERLFRLARRGVESPKGTRNA